jgi:hypothetical protein
MNKLSHSELHDRIAAVERRLERRRARLLDDASETAAAASQTATKVLPVAAALGAGLLALYFMRRRSTVRTYSAYRAQYADPRRRGLRWAQLVGIIGSAVRIATSPQVRAFWHGFRRARQRRRY